MEGKTPPEAFLSSSKGKTNLVDKQEADYLLPGYLTLRRSLSGCAYFFSAHFSFSVLIVDNFVCILRMQCEVLVQSKQACNSSRRTLPVAHPHVEVLEESISEK